MPAPPSLASAALKEAVQQLNAAQKSEAAVPDGFDGRAVTGALLDAAASGQIDASDPGKLLGAGLAVVGGVACASTGALAPLAPVCAAAGGIVGELVGSLFADPPKPPPAPTDADRLVAAKTADRQWIQSRRTKILAEALAKVGSVAKARQQLEETINDFLPLLPDAATEQAEIFSGHFPSFPEKSWFGGFALILQPWPVVFGSKLPPEVSITEPEGAIRYVYQIAKIVQAQGMSFEGQLQQIVGWIQGHRDQFNLFLGSSGVQGLDPRWFERVPFGLYEQIRSYLFPVLEEALRQRLQAVYAGAAIASKIVLVSALRKLAGQLQASGLSASDARAFADEAAGMLATQSPEQVYQQLAKGLELSHEGGPGQADKGGGWGRWVLGGLVVASGAAGAVVAVRAAQGKPPLPAAVQRRADQASAAVDRAGKTIGGWVRRVVR